MRFGRALETAEGHGSSLLGYELTHRADIRGKLGDYAGAEADLLRVSKYAGTDSFMADGVFECECDLETSRKRFKEALAAGLHAADFHKQLPTPVVLCQAIARFHLGSQGDGLRVAREALLAA
jgi:hypothetical protein